jgi:hypothetical protein
VGFIGAFNLAGALLRLAGLGATYIPDVEDPLPPAIGGVVFAAAWFITDFLRRPAETVRATGPGTLLRADRVATLTRACGLAAGLGATVYGFKDVIGFGWTLVFVAALVGLVIGVAGSAWARFLAARTWLAVGGELPWRLMRFLRDARVRGVLRQSGAVYEFRHALLRERLASDAPLIVDESPDD